MTYLPACTASRGGVVLEPRTGPAGLGPGLLPPKRCRPLAVGAQRVLRPTRPSPRTVCRRGRRAAPPPPPRRRGHGRTRIRLSDSTLLSPVEKNSQKKVPLQQSRAGRVCKSSLCWAQTPSSRPKGRWRVPREEDTVRVTQDRVSPESQRLPFVLAGGVVASLAGGPRVTQQGPGTGSSQASRGAPCPPDSACDEQPQCLESSGPGGCWVGKVGDDSEVMAASFKKFIY